MLVILGCGESGMGAALLAHKLAIPVFVSDSGIIKDEFKKHLIDEEIDFEEGGHTIIYEFTPSFVVKSPGIPDSSDVVKYYIERNIEVISEIEFAYRNCTGKIIAITGSNGKTTTTNLIYHILKSSNFSVAKVGNIGYSFARSLAQQTYNYYVIEVSSFQLDSIVSFKPYIGIILNITPDHLDRYDNNYEKYIASKFRMGLNQNSQDHLILYKDPTIVKSYSSINLSSQISWIQSELTTEELIYINETEGPSLKHSTLKGKHNAMNVACAVKACTILGLTKGAIQLAINSFVNDPHRLESITSIDGVEYINDSKATNVDSVYWALDAMKSNVIWIAGGQDKGNDYSILLPLVKEKVKTLVTLGVDNSKLIDYFSPYVTVVDTHSIQECVNVCNKISKEGDTVLFSPACASFDLFKNYMHRGDEFRNEVLKLKTN
ncbi:MAG: UDP-N-acetylmuramoyl-L-alanine--D-glutamate ligase [Saprospiraceae bacterium]|nr:UDP-N-acetylmuramoyl-L-alanine--D-glutamate ligase [Saprospiraceae bacterium]